MLQSLVVRGPGGNKKKRNETSLARLAPGPAREGTREVLISEY